MKKKREVNRTRTLVGAGEGRREDLLLEQRPERALLREVRQRQRPVQPVPQLQDPLPLLHGRVPAGPWQARTPPPLLTYTPSTIPKHKDESLPKELEAA